MGDGGGVIGQNSHVMHLRSPCIQQRCQAVAIGIMNVCGRERHSGFAQFVATGENRHRLFVINRQLMVSCGGGKGDVLGAQARPFFDDDRVRRHILTHCPTIDTFVGDGQRHMGVREITQFLRQHRVRLVRHGCPRHDPHPLSRRQCERLIPRTMNTPISIQRHG